MTSSGTTKTTDLSPSEGLGTTGDRDQKELTDAITIATFHLDKLNETIPFFLDGAEFQMTKLSEDVHDDSHDVVERILSNVEGKTTSEQTPETAQRIQNMVSQRYQTKDSIVYRVDHIDHDEEESEKELHGVLNITAQDKIPVISVQVMAPEHEPETEGAMDTHHQRRLYLATVDTMTQEIMKSFEGVSQISGIPVEVVESGELDSTPLVLTVESGNERSKWLQDEGWRMIGTVRNDLYDGDILIKKAGGAVAEPDSALDRD